MTDGRREDTGCIEVICGSMFSGKSEELIRRLRRAKIARQKVLAFKPRIDDRYDEEDIVSHDDRRIESVRIDDASEIPGYVGPDVQVVGIDEAQFLGSKLPEVCEELANRGVRVIVAGLDQDYLGRPFEPMPQLLSVSEYITKTLAVCMKCGRPANRTQRITQSTERVVVGASEVYEARCRHCFDPEEPAKQGTSTGFAEVAAGGAATGRTGSAAAEGNKDAG
jgi:thymidine kinase